MAERNAPANVADVAILLIGDGAPLSLSATNSATLL
jgi:hypothetical protein